MQYHSFDPGPCGFPRPKVPVLPTVHRNSLKLVVPPESPDLAAAPDIGYYARGRYALLDACRLCGVGIHSGLLAPSYHCRTMLDPAIRLGAQVDLYPLNPDLSPDAGRLEALISTRQRPVGALLLTHYFGFAQSLEPVLEICSRHGIAVIEDCSHCLIANTGSPDVGRRGRYSVWSPYKFFPCEDGGMLQSNHGAAMPARHRQRPGLQQEARAWVRSVQRSRAARPALHAQELDSAIQGLAGSPTPPGRDLLHTSPATSAEYDPTMENQEGLASSRWIMRHTDVARLRSERRSNYLRWLEVAAALPHCRALYPVLAADCVPYMFPLHIDHPGVHFHALKRLGVPVWRWDDMAVADCTVASCYRLQLLQLPCHQELTAEQMDWMARAVTKVLRGIPVEAPA